MPSSEHEPGQALTAGEIVDFVWNYKWRIALGLVTASAVAVVMSRIASDGPTARCFEEVVATGPGPSLDAEPMGPPEIGRAVDACLEGHNN